MAEAAAPLSQIAAADDEDVMLAAVRLRDREDRPRVAAPVAFEVVSPSGVLRVRRVPTDGTGVSRLVAPLLGEDLGRWFIRPLIPGERTPIFELDVVPRGTFADGARLRCPWVREALPRFGMLGATVMALRAGAPVAVVAFGSSSTYGTGASSPAMSYPSLLREQLARIFPTSTIRVVNAGEPGDASPELWARFERDVLAHRPTLVVLQTGTNDALRRLPVDSLRTTTARMIERIRAAGSDVVLLDQQRFPGFGTSPEYRVYVDAVREIGAELGVPVARRYAWMEGVIAAGRYTMADLIGGDDLHQTDLANECTARLLSTGVAVASVLTSR